MSIPVIQRLAGLLILTKDEAMTPRTILASNTPTSWTAGTMPTGLSFSSGKISGTPTVAGVTSVSIKATNASGDSAPILVDFKVLAEPAANDDGLVLLNWDLQTGLVSNPSYTADGPQAYFKAGDKVAFALGIVSDNELRRLTITDIKVTLRDTYEAPICTVFSGAPGAPLDIARPRYRILCDMTAAEVATTLAEHSDDGSIGGTDYEQLAKCEIQITHAIDSIGGTSSIERTSVTFPVQLARRLITP